MNPRPLMMPDGGYSTANAVPGGLGSGLGDGRVRLIG
jgi:hypothetical protein